MVDADITVLDRGRVECDMNYLVEGYTMGSKSQPQPEIDMVKIPVYNLVIDHPEGVILWDTGVTHNAVEEWPDDVVDAFYPHVEDHRLDDDLEKAGHSIEEIDYIVQTHLHQDHAGGLEFFADTSVPVFVHEDEIQYAYYSAKTNSGSDAYLENDFDHDVNWRIIHGDGKEYFEGLEFIHLPGHTPGLFGMLADIDGTGSILFAGDEIYRRENYEDETPLGANLIWSHPHWRDTLNKVKDLERRHDAEVVYGHDLTQFNEFKSGW